MIFCGGIRAKITEVMKMYFSQECQKVTLTELFWLFGIFLSKWHEQLWVKTPKYGGFLLMERLPIILFRKPEVWYAQSGIE